jgi:tetratricopeptide (TPR) repeat protein
MERYLAARAGLGRSSAVDMEERERIAAAFDSIVQQAPNFARALGARAYTRAWVAFVRPSRESYAAALSDADRATELDPDLAEPRVARASLAWSSLGGWDVVKAVRELKRALAQSPGLEIAHFDLARIYHHNGWFAEADAALRDGERINPRNIELPRQRAVIKIWGMGSLREAAEMFDRLPEETRRLWAFRWQRAWLRAVLEDPGRVEREVEPVVQEDTQELKPMYSGILAILRARQGRDFADLEERIRAADHRMGHFHHTYHFLADALAQRGEAARAADYLRRAGETGMPCALCFDNDPLLAPIRGSKEYGAAREEVERRNAEYRAALKGVL